MKRVERVFTGIWFVFRTAPVPTIFLVVWVAFLIWVMAASWS